MENLTERQGEVLSCIKSFIKQNGYPPTYREICSIMNIGSTNAVHKHLMAIESKGFVKLGMSKARAIKIL
jgi:repressor LexA